MCTMHCTLSMCVYLFILIAAKKNRILTGREMVENDIYAELKMGKRIAKWQTYFSSICFCFIAHICLLLDDRICELCLRNSTSCVCIRMQYDNVQRHSLRCAAFYSQFMSGCFLIVRCSFFVNCTFFDIFHSDHACMECALCSTFHKRQQRLNTASQYSDCHCFMRCVTFTIWLQLVDNRVWRFSSSLFADDLFDQTWQATGQQLIALISTDQFDAFILLGRSLR